MEGHTKGCKDRREVTSRYQKALTATLWGLIKLNSIRRYKVQENMQIFYDIFNLLTTFQMSYIYHQVTILVYKILIKNICIINTPYGNKTITIW